MNPQVELGRLLSQELNALKARHPRYSLRAFARKIKIAPAALSQIINGKRCVSPKMAEKLLQHVSTDPAVAKDVLKRFSQLQRPRKINALSYTVIDREAYKVLAQGHHIAILALAETSDFICEKHWIAKRLGITPNRAELALLRMEQTGLIRRTDDGLLLLNPRFSTSDDIRDRSIQSSHREGLHLAAKSLAKDAVETRDFTSLILAVNMNKISDAKLIIRRFLDEISQVLEDGEKKEVYRVCIQMFPLSKEIVDSTQTKEVNP